MNRLTLVTGMALGAGMMYMLDPQAGGRRRALVRDQIVHYTTQAEKRAAGRMEDVQNRAQGLAAETRARAEEGPVDDLTLQSRVRAELGHHTDHAGEVTVQVDSGNVTLRGAVEARKLEEVILAARQVRGVRSVVSELQPVH